MADSGGDGATGWFSQLSGRFAVVRLPQPSSCTGAGVGVRVQPSVGSFSISLIMMVAGE